MNNNERREWIKAHLACPSCRVAIQTQGKQLRCPACSTVFEQAQGILLMLPYAQRNHVHGIAQKRVGRGPSSWQQQLKRGLMPPSPSLNVTRGATYVLSQWPTETAVLEIGSGVRRLGENVVNLELDIFPHVDVVALGEAIPFLDNCFDLVICEAVLEHVPNPADIVSEIWRVLKPGGQVYVEIPFLQGFHADPHDYQRYTLPGIEQLMCHFAKLESGIAVGPSSAMVWIIREYIPLFFPQFMQKIVALGTAWLVAPLKYLDKWLSHKPEASRIAAGFYFWGFKPKTDADLIR